MLFHPIYVEMVKVANNFWFWSWSVCIFPDVSVVPDAVSVELPFAIVANLCVAQLLLFHHDYSTLSY